jgi:hypothetical protein
VDNKIWKGIRTGLEILVGVGSIAGMIGGICSYKFSKMDQEEMQSNLNKAIDARITEKLLGSGQKDNNA